MSSLIEYVKAEVDPRQFYASVFPDVKWPSGGSEARVLCPFHAEKSPSLSLNGETGQWFCHGCDVGGNSIVSFHAKHINQSKVEAAADLFSTWLHPTIQPKTIRQWVRRLKETPSALKYLKNQRGLSDKVIERFEIGYDGSRFTIPIRNEFGLIVNVKRYDPLSKKHGTPKMISYKRDGESREFGAPAMIYPIQVLQEMRKEKRTRVVVCEGEWDALLLISLGIDAVTSTNGSKSWPTQYNSLFKGLHVVIAYDNDKDGMMYDRKVVLKNLRSIVRTAKRLQIPKLPMPNNASTKDVTDWWLVDQNMRKRANWIEKISRTPKLLENPAETIEASDVQQVPLDQASQSKWLNKTIRVDALISGKDFAPYILPKTFRATCNKSCDACPLAEKDKDFIERKFEPNDPTLLQMIDAPESKLRKLMLTKCGMDDGKNCGAKVEVVDSFNIEQILLIPTLDSKSSQYVTRTSFYVGHGLHSNRAYQFEGITTPNPNDQHATHLFTQAKPVQDEVGTFVLTPEMREELKIFRPRRLNLYAHLMSIADWQSRHITKIRQRPDLHVGVDLVFHSASAFDFNGEYVRRGMLDALVIGDTRCGKGYVTEGLVRFYGLGEVASGENCSFAGLIGGVQQSGTKRWMITWGLIPLNNGRLVVIDEASALTEKAISDMSRVRSEGVAEINKIIRESTQANTRLIWLANPRDGRPICERNHGVQAIKELIGANEDISRFDFAMTVATNEVPSEIINFVTDKSDVSTDADKYPQRACRSLVLWAWSRRPEQIKFSPGATQEIINQSIRFGHTYSPSIPLVQAENIRIKIAKISAAVAARVFSSDESGENLIINAEHVQCACQFLRLAYSKPSMAYDAFSDTAISHSKLDNNKDIEQIFARMTGRNREATVNGLLELYRVTPDSLGDYVDDPQYAKTVIGELVRLHCLTRIEGGNWYLKNPVFSAWLRAQRGKHNGQSSHRARP